MFISFSHAHAIYRVYAAEGKIDNIELNGTNFAAQNGAPKIPLVFLRAGYITKNDNQNTWTVHAFNCVVTFNDIDLAPLVNIPGNAADNTKPSQWADGTVGCKQLADVVLNQEENISYRMGQEAYFGNGNAPSLADVFPIQAYAADFSTPNFQFSITIDNPYLILQKRANNGHNGLDFYIGLYFRFNFKNVLYYKILKDATLANYGLLQLDRIPNNIQQQVQREQEDFQKYITDTADPDSDSDEEAYLTVLLLTPDEQAKAANNGVGDNQQGRKLLCLV